MNSLQTERKPLEPFLYIKERNEKTFNLIKRECQFKKESFSPYTLNNEEKDISVCLPWQTHLWPFSKSKFNVKSDRVNLVASASPIKCLLYLPNGRTKQYKLGPEKLTRLGNSNVLRLPVFSLFPSLSLHCKKTDGHWQRWVLTTSFFQAPGINFP